MAIRSNFLSATGVVLGLGVLFAGAPANAYTFVIDPSAMPGDTPGTYIYFFDYTVPSDGQAYRWDFSFTSADPNATLFLNPPNQVDSIAEYETASGVTAVSAGFPSYTFDETEKPGLLSILVQAPAAYDHCVAGVISASPCGMINEVFGNGTQFTGSALEPLTVTWTITAVPEPAQWALMLVGMGILGAGLRRRGRFGALPT